MRHRFTRVIVLVSALAIVAAACGSDKAATPTTAAGTTTSGVPGATTTSGAATTTTATTKAAGKGGLVTKAQPTTNTKAGGTIVFGAEQEPLILNTLLSDGNLFANSLISKGVFPALMVVAPDFSLTDYVEDGPPTVDSTSPFTVTWKIKQEAAWEDGTPLTSDDVKATFDYILDEANEITDRTGYDKVTEFKINGPKSFTLVFSEIYAPYRYMFSVSGAIYKKKALDDFTAGGGAGNDFLRDGIPFSAGPFKLDSFTRGDNITLVKNTSYWGKNKPQIDKIIFKFLESGSSLVQAIEAKDVDIIYPQPGVQLVQQASKIEFANYQLSLGTVWEHLDFNIGKVPAFQDVNVRKALAHGIDRKTVIDTIIKPLVGDQPVPPLGNVAYVPNQKEYVDHFSQYNYDPSKAEQMLEAAGWKKGADGIRAKGDQKLSFTYATTTPNPGRELQQQLIQTQLKAIGVEIKPANRPAKELFSADVLRSGNFEIINFAYVASPDPGGTPPIFRGDKCPKSVPGCTAEDGQNYINYQNAKVTELLTQSDVEADPVKRAALINEADKLIGEDVPILPLYQKPTFVLYNSRLANIIDNPTQEGPLWNADMWAEAS